MKNLHKNEEFIAAVLSGDKVSTIARKLGEPESTVRDNKKKVIARTKSVSDYRATEICKQPVPGIMLAPRKWEPETNPAIIGDDWTKELKVGDAPPAVNPFQVPQTVYPCPASWYEEMFKAKSAKEVEVPTIIPEKKWERFSIVTDTHGDLIDETASSVFFNFIENDWKPTIRAHLGDFLDLAPLRTGASPEDQKECMYNDFDKGNDFLYRYFESNKDNTNLLTLGNHDERLWEWTHKINAVQRHWAKERVAEQEATFEELNLKWVNYNKYKYLSIGKLNLVHGFTVGLSACRNTAFSYGHVAFGHTHAIECCTIPNIERSVGFNIGTLAKLDMSYSSRMQSTLRHAQGFAHGVVNKETGNYHLWQDRELDGLWILPSDTVEVS